MSAARAGAAGIVALPANQPPDRFYRGGRRIDDFRGVAPGPDHRPEDWVASTTTLAGEAGLGLTSLPDGRALADAVNADPIGWLGAEHVRAFGASTMLLVKLLDAGQRLPVHAHPDDAFSRAHTHRSFGKAEAWYIIEGGTVHLGLRHPIARDALLDLVRRQDTDALLHLLHAREVVAGDVVFVPPGELHAIGEGVFLVEVQQPEDLSILLEWRGFVLDGARDGHLGLGFDLALDAVVTDGCTSARLDRLIGPAGEGPSVLPAESEAYFRLERLVVRAPIAVEQGFAVLVVERGTVTVLPERGDSLELRAGSTAVVPHAAGVLTLSGAGVALLCRPPAAGPGTLA